MSFQAASRELGRDKQFTSMTLIGGYDCDPNNPRKGIDLRVKGGAIIEKSMCILGNINASGMIDGNLCGTLLTTKIQEKELTQGIEICGNLLIDTESVLTGNVCVPSGGSIQTPKIEEKVTGEGICFNGDITAPGDLMICNDGDLYLKPTGMVIISNSAQELDLSKQVIANILRLEAADGCPLGLEAPPGFKIEITSGDGIDLMGRDLCNVGNISGQGTNPIIIPNDLDLDCGNITNVNEILVDNINEKTNDNGVMVDGVLIKDGSVTANINIQGDLDMNCANVANVGHLFVSNIHGKSPITVHDDLELLGTTSVNNAANVISDTVTTNNLNGAGVGDLSGVTNEQIVVYDTTNQEFRPKTLSAGTNISITPSLGSLLITNTLSAPTVTYGTGTLFLRVTNPAPSSNPLISQSFNYQITSIPASDKFATVYFRQAGSVHTSAWGGTNTQLFTLTNPLGVNLIPDSSQTIFGGYCNAYVSGNPSSSTDITRFWSGIYTNGGSSNITMNSIQHDFDAGSGSGFTLFAWTLGPYAVV